MSQFNAQQASSQARAVVAIDFGTTYSGFAYAKTLEPEAVYSCYEWPGATRAGSKPYCKTQTSLYYVPSTTTEGHFELKDWSWCGLLQLYQAARAAKINLAPSVAMNNRIMWRFPAQNTSSSSSASSPHAKDDTTSLFGIADGMNEKMGFFATNFKLHLASDGQFYRARLPGDLTAESMIVDFLECLSKFVMSELQLKYGKHFSMTDVQWCLTVPAIWNERAKQVMKVCAEKAGMVVGAWCPTPKTASPYPLDIVLEPEAASVYCQKKAKSILELRRGDKMLVADVGGGTIDLVVHEKADEDPKSMSVHEVVSSYGTLGGGTFVDSHFIRFLSDKIGCFHEHCRDNPSVGLSIFGWWQGIKMGFDGHGYSAELPVPRKLSEAWEKYDKLHGIYWDHDDDHYDEVKLKDTDIMSIFDEEVDKVLKLIEKQIEGVRVLMVVGGFSASPYLRTRIQSAFKERVEELIIPENPGSAICHGAVQLHMANDIIQSRVAKRTFGIECIRQAQLGDPPELVFIDDDGRRMCDSTLEIFATAGDRVPLNATLKKIFSPSMHAQKQVSISLHSAPSMCPKFTTEAEVEEEGSFILDIKEDMWLDKERKVEVSMCFGASLVRVDAQRLNFGDRDTIERGISVKFQA